ncbi:hypothetical protein BTN50_1431 [Candidatus Enterovibrio altilux]|uniref:Mobile element protein n=1 Tax=Candidatus Enterovibrio altilux TaxID=1927128 RepID=A0A291BA96_9GAMM|nr:hypothetical protein BTN50_1431 [Candidatus Enterovibrio luxaltus]
MVDINTHAIIAFKFSASNMINSEMLSNFFKQTRQKINKI